MKLCIKIIFILTILCAQAPLDLIIDTNERDVEINPGISVTRVVLIYNLNLVMDVVLV